jgi:hypothetical protein
MLTLYPSPPVRSNSTWIIRPTLITVRRVSVLLVHSYGARCIMWKLTVRNDISNGQDHRDARSRAARIWRPTAYVDLAGVLRYWGYSYECSCELDSTMSENTTVDDVDSHVVYSNSPAWNTGALLDNIALFLSINGLSRYLVRSSSSAFDGN